MASTQVDRLSGLRAGVAVKAPCAAATVANITLFDLQTIDAVALVDGDRVLVKDQTDGSQNGIYYAKDNDFWARTPDFNSSNDLIKGTRVFINDGTVSQTVEYAVTNSGTIVLGTTDLVFESLGSSTALDLGDGSAANPSLAFTSDPDTGVYRPGANQFGVSAGGQVSGIFTSNGIATVLTDTPTATGTANALVAATTIGVTLQDVVRVTIKTSAANSGAATLNVDATGIKAIRRQADTALEADDMLAAGTYNFRYDTAYNSSAGAWVLTNGSDTFDSGTLGDLAVLDEVAISDMATGSFIEVQTLEGTVFNPPTPMTTAEGTVKSTTLFTPQYADSKLLISVQGEMQGSGTTPKLGIFRDSEVNAIGQTNITITNFHPFYFTAYIDANDTNEQSFHFRTTGASLLNFRIRIHELKPSGT